MKRGLPLLVVGIVAVVRRHMAGKLGADVMTDFVPVAKTSEIPDPGKMLVEVGERLVVLIHAAGHYYALDDICTHDGGPLSEGPLDPAGQHHRLSAPRGEVRHPHRRRPHDAGHEADDGRTK